MVRRGKRSRNCIAARCEKRPRARLETIGSAELAAGGKLETFVTRGLPQEDADIAAYGFMKELMASGGKYTSLIVAMRGGEEFDRAFPRGLRPTADYGPQPGRRA